jgi:hypothetical protein
MRKITPSRIDPWEGTPVEGSPYTAEQLRVMQHERPGWTHFRNRTVRLKGEPLHRWEPPEEVVVECPIIAWTKDKARVLVITPGGFKEWMAAHPGASS